jgi:hypothetical protein
MPDGALVIDNDAFILLSAAGLLQAAITSLGFDGKAVRLAALPFVIGRNKKLQKQYSGDALIRAKLACDEVPELSSAPGPDVLQTLAAVPDIDDGEAVLYGLLYENPGHLLLSGDKRAMIAVATTPELGDIRAKIAGRVVCVEKIINLLLTAHGHEHVVNAVLPIRDSNSTLRVIFSDGNCNDQAACSSAVSAYIVALEIKVGAGFLYGA